MNRRVAGVTVLFWIALGLSSCGGGSGGAPPPPPPPSPSFTFNPSPQQQVVNPGSSATFNIAVLPANGFNQNIQISLSDLPSGITSSPVSIPPTGGEVSLTASPSTALQTVTITITATAGSITRSESASLSVTPPPAGLPNNRTSFVRTDDTPVAVVYDPQHQQLFASKPNLNSVDVISVATQQVLRSIAVPAPMVMSLSADGTEVLVGTQVGKVAWIDTASLQVVRLATVPVLPQTIGLPGYNYLSPKQPVQAANGKVFLFSFRNGPAVPAIYMPSSTVAEWNPATGVTKARPDGGNGNLVSVSADHTKILIAGQATFSLYDSGSDTFTPLSGLQFATAALNPAGTQFVAVGGTPFLRFFNTQMQPLGSIDIPDCCLGGTETPSAVYSADGKSLYLAYSAQGTGIHKLSTVDVATFQVRGSAANLSTDTPFVGGSTQGIPQGNDSTGLVFEIADHGVGIVDATDMRTFADHQIIPEFIIATPGEGPVNQSTNTQFTTAIFASLPDVFFGNQRALNPNLFNSSGQLAATAPPFNAVGPVNVKTLEPDGSMGFMPQGFSYGSLPMQFGLLASAPAGGVVADLFGYGYSVDVTLVPPKIDVTIGSASAVVESKNGFTSVTGYPFPLQHFAITVPQGTTGAQDINVSSVSGVGTSPKAFHYVKSVTDYSSADSFQYVLFDSLRNQVYLSAGDHVDVFSLNSNSFVAPTPVPSRGGTHLVLGLALTPDSSKLLIANQSDQSVVIVNPDNAAVGAVVVPLPLSSFPNSLGPFEIAATSTNHAFITVANSDLSTRSGGPVFDLDLATLKATSVTIPANITASNTYIAASSDGTAVVLAGTGDSSGPIADWLATSKTWQVRATGEISGQVAISGDGNILTLSTRSFPVMFDSQLRTVSQASLPEFQIVTEGPAVQFDQTGALLYSTNPTGIDIFDTRLGQLRERVLLSEQMLIGPSPLSQGPQRLMDVSPDGSQVVLLTKSGLTVVDLDSVPLGIGSVTPATAAAGAQVTVRGTGFVNGTSSIVNAVSASTTFVNSSTLKITVPPSLAGVPAQLTLTNPDGSMITVDDAFVVN